MGRKRKISIVDEEKENEDGASRTNNRSSTTSCNTLHHGPMYTIMSNVQLNETFHRKYIKEMQQLYTKVSFISFFRLHTFNKALPMVNTIFSEDGPRCFYIHFLKNDQNCYGGRRGKRLCLHNFDFLCKFCKFF